MKGPTEKLSKLVDHWLQPVVHSLPSFVQDTTHFLQTIEEWKRTYEPLPKEVLIVTLDLVGLYSNIPHQEVAVLTDTLACQNHLTTQAPPTCILLEIVKHILNNNIRLWWRNLQANLQDSNVYTHGPLTCQCLHGLAEAADTAPVPMAHQHQALETFY